MKMQLLEQHAARIQDKETVFYRDELGQLGSVSMEEAILKGGNLCTGIMINNYIFAYGLTTDCCNFLFIDLRVQLRSSCW